MSKGQWLRDPTTGMTVKQFDKIDGSFVRPDGSFAVELLPDCNVYNQRSAAWLACGWINVAEIEAAMVADPHYPWRLIVDPDGRVVQRATHCDTAAHWGLLRAIASRDTSLQNLKPFRIRGVLTPDGDQNTPAITQTPPTHRPESP
jgi:hypothetical protein